MPQDFFYYDPSQKPVAGTPLDLDHWASNATSVWPLWEASGAQSEDVLGNNTGVLNSGASWGSSAYSAGVRTDGSTGQITVANGPILRGLTSGTVSFIGTPSAVGAYACYSENVSGGQAFCLAITASPFNFVFQVKQSNSLFASAVGTTTLKAGVRYHVVGVFQPGKFLVYVNGNLEGTSSWDNTIVALPTIKSLIGNFTNSGGPFSWNGVIESVSVYQNMALTADQVKVLYERPYEMFVQKRFPLHGRKSTVLRPRGPTWRGLTPLDERPEVGTPINIQSDMADGLYAYFPFWEMAGQQVEDVTGSGRAGAFAFVNNPSLQSFKWNDDGFSVTSSSQFANSQFNLPLDFANDFGTSKIPDFSIVFRFDTSIGATIFTHHTGTFGNALQIGASATSISFTFNGNYSASCSGPFGVYTCVFVKRGTQAFYYIDGKLQATLSLTGGNIIAGDNTQQKSMFTLGAANTIKYQGIAFYTRALNASEIERWSETNGKWRVFRHQRNGASTSPIAAKTYVSSRRLDVKDLTQKPDAGTPLDLDHWASNALAIWPMWEGGGQQIEDLTGNGHTATIAIASPLAANGPEGVVFSGGGGATLSAIPQLTNWTWVAIIKPSNQSSTYANMITFGANRGIWINSSKIDMFKISDHLANTTLQIGVEQHVAVSCDSTGVVHFYYNGNPDGFAFTSADTYPFNAIGADNGVNGESYNGLMKSVWLFGYVLTPDQVKALYERPYEMFSQNRRGRSVVMPPRLKVGSSRGVSSPGIEQLHNELPIPGTPINTDHWASNAVAYWPIWEGAGQTIEDVGNSSIGVLSGGVSWK